MQAVSQLTNWQSDTTQRSLSPRYVQPRQPETRQDVAPTADWLRQAQELTERSASALWQMPTAIDYLFNRGLIEDTIRKFNLGYRPDAWLPGTWDAKRRERCHPGQPAILMPWYKDGQVYAIRYRFLTRHEYTDSEGKARKEKQSAQPGSSFAGLLFGVQSLTEGSEPLRTLVLCEGELNLASIWQVSNAWRWDCLSVGSESAKLTQAMIDRAKKYQQVIIWMDKESIAKQFMSMIPGSCAISSDLLGMDANDCLQHGTLAAALIQASMSCRPVELRKTFLYDLLDAHEGLSTVLDKHAVKTVNEWSRKIIGKDSI